MMRIAGHALRGGSITVTVDGESVDVPIPSGGNATEIAAALAAAIGGRANGAVVIPPKNPRRANRKARRA